MEWDELDESESGRVDRWTKRGPEYNIVKSPNTQRTFLESLVTPARLPTHIVPTLKDYT